MTELYISDLDGTLLNSNQQVSEDSKKLINEMIRNGLNFTIATARSVDSAYPIIKDLNIKIPAIFHNGVIVYDIFKKKVVKRNTLDCKTTNSIIDIMQKHNISPFVFTYEESGNKVLFKELNTEGQKAFYNGKLKAGDKRFRKVENFDIKGKEIIMVNTLANYDELKPIKDELGKIANINILMVKEIYHDSWFLEVTSNKASKQNGLNELKKITRAKKVTCFGDNLNDLPLFKSSDVKIAVKNGVKELKQKADFIIDDNNSNSVAKWIYNNFDK